MEAKQTPLWHPGLWIALAAGLALKAVILATGAATFDADEAILALMARHTLQGEPALFFYGQNYMGALDAYLIAGSFLAFGERVLSVRLTQVMLYAGVLVTTYILAWRITEDRWAAAAAGGLIALPTVLFSTYTTATLGNYVEVLLINNLLFLIVWDILSGRSDKPVWWLVAGLLAGIGWWGMALVIVAIAPLALLGLWHYRESLPWQRIALLVAGFAVGALPWFAGIIGSPTGILADLSGARVVDPGGGFGPRVVSLLLFNLPALFGLRAPWSASFILLPVGVVALAGILLVLVDSVRGWSAGTDYQRIARRTLLIAFAVLCVLFTATRFGIDPTGRYLLHLYPPLVLLIADWMHRMRPRQAALALSLPLILGGYYLYGNIQAIVNTPPGLTTQFDPVTHIPHTHDDDLVAFLDAIGVDRGYSNYWVAYRFAFQTGERIILSPALPDKTDLAYTPSYDRYPAYTDEVNAADEVVYITSNLPQLDAELARRFDVLDVSYRVEDIGPYTVFYDLSRAVRPAELGGW